MKTIEQKAARLKVSSLKHHPRNPNRGDTEAVKESIETNGFFGRIVVQKGTNLILAGNHRYDAAKALGARTVPCWVVDVDEVTALKILLVDNRTASLAESDEDRLGAILQFLAAGEAGLAGTGYTSDELERLLGKAPSLSDIEDEWPAAIRQVVVPCDVDEYDEVLACFARIMEATGTDTNADALRHLLAEVEV